MHRAYVLLKFRHTAGEALPIQETIEAIRAIPGVKEAYALFGDIDGIAHVEATSPKLLTAIIQQISAISAIERTDTRIVVPS